jgi:STIP1 family protein 1
MSQSIEEPLPSEQTIMKLKEQANRSYSLGKFSSAREIYTEAIMMKPKSKITTPLAKLFSVLYSNRALAIKEGSVSSSTTTTTNTPSSPTTTTTTSTSTEIEATLPSSLVPWQLIEEDCLAAVELDGHNAKAHYLLGLCYCRRLEWVKGVKQLEHSLEMAKRQQKPPSLLKEFESAIAVERYHWHKAFFAEERQADDDLLSFYDGLLLKASQDEVNSIQNQNNLEPVAVCNTATPQAEPSTNTESIRPITPSLLAAAAANRVRPATASYVSDLNSASIAESSTSTSATTPTTSSSSSSTSSSSLNPRERARQALLESKRKMNESVNEIEAAFLRRRADLADVFAEREQRRTPRQSAPIYYTCSITLEVMLDPVLTPCGHSYERSALEHYLKSVKPEDPLSRKFLSAEMLIPNIALRQAIAAYLAECPWAHPYLPVGTVSRG